MALKVIINVDNPGDLLTGYGAGALLRLERDTTSAFGAPTEVTTVPLVASQSQYEVWDAAGSDASWYRSRISDSGGTTFSAYSPAFQAGAVAAYASVDALRELLQLPNNDRDNLLADILRRVTTKIDTSLRFDFRRHPPVSGTEVRTFDVRHTGDYRLYVPEGISSLSLVELGRYSGSTYSSLAAGDWALREQAVPGGPYLSLVLTGVSTRWFSSGYDTIRLTGVFGYETVPADVEQATLYWAADLYRIGASGGVVGVGVGIEEFGTPRFLGGAPRIAYETLEDYRKAHNGALVR